MSDLTGESAGRLAELIRTQQVSAVEVLEAHLARVALEIREIPLSPSRLWEIVREAEAHKERE